MDFLTSVQLELMEIEDIFQHLDKVNEQVTIHEIRFEEVPKELLHRTKLESKDLKSFFEFDHQRLVYQFPHIDQQEKFEGVTFMGHRPLPVKGFFWKTSLSLKMYEFGLLYMLFELKKISPASDLSHLGDRTVFKEEYDLMYDFDTNQYVHVQPKNEEDYEEFNERRQLYAVLLERLEKDNDIYKNNLQEAVNVLGIHTNRTLSDVKVIKKLFQYTKNFMDQNIKHIRSKVFLAQITKDHFLVLKNEMEAIAHQVPMKLKWLEEFEVKNYRSIANYGGFDMELEEKSKLIHQFQLRIVQLFVYRDSKSVHFKTKDGFIGINEDRLFENLSQIEVESSLAIRSETRNKREQEKRELFLEWKRETKRESR